MVANCGGFIDLIVPFRSILWRYRRIYQRRRTNPAVIVFISKECLASKVPAHHIWLRRIRSGSSCSRCSLRRCSPSYCICYSISNQGPSVLSRGQRTRRPTRKPPLCWDGRCRWAPGEGSGAKLGAGLCPSAPGSWGWVPLAADLPLQGKVHNTQSGWGWRDTPPIKVPSEMCQSAWNPQICGFCLKSELLHGGRHRSLDERTHAASPPPSFRQGPIVLTVEEDGLEATELKLTRVDRFHKSARTTVVSPSGLSPHTVCLRDMYPP